MAQRKARATSTAGFTLLLAALVASIVLGLGSSIFQIAQKQLTLSGTGRDSQFAFYVADTAAECALYWDFRFSYFALTTPTVVDPTCDNVSAAFDNTNFAPSVRPSPVYPYTMRSQRMDLFPEKYCAEVYVTQCQGKFVDGICVLDDTKPVSTLIHADGYSVDCASISTSPRALQRSVELYIGS